jgi:uncharacterized protein (TIGR00299 family) protein
MKIAYFDCFSGASGDMILGALIDAGADFDALRRGLESLGVEGYRVSTEKLNKAGTAATKFNVEEVHHHHHHDHEHEHGEHHHHPHRHLKHILEIIDRGELPEPVKEASRKTFQRIAEVEAAIHSTTVEKIHFHEVGAIDSIVDIIGANLALHLLGIERVYSSPLHVGAGTVKCAHGIMPVPAPATAALLEGVPAYGGEVQGELVTPTGAALLSQWTEDRFGGMPAMRIASVGYGSGTRELPDRPNVLRVLVGETADAAQPGEETIAVLEANLDDMNPELYPPLLASLLEAGARDAFVTPIIGKKGRPAHLVTILCDEAKVRALAGVLFRGSKTLGVRIRSERRICLERAWKTVRTRYGEVRVKIGKFEGEITTTSPEFEDCRKVAELAGVSPLAVYEAALVAALGGEIANA